MGLEAYVKGKNVLRVNSATIKEAMQEYLDRRFLDGESPVVEFVAYDSNHRAADDHYVFTLSERTGEEPK